MDTMEKSLRIAPLKKGIRTLKLSKPNFSLKIKISMWFHKMTMRFKHRLCHFSLS